MRIGLAGVGPLGDAHRLDAFGHDDARHVLDVLEESLEPALEIEAVPQHEIGRLRPHDVERRRLVVVDLGARLGDRFDDGLVAGDVLRDVLDDREGRHDAERLARRRGLPGAGQDGGDEHYSQGAEPQAARDTDPHRLLQKVKLTSPAAVAAGLCKCELFAISLTVGLRSVKCFCEVVRNW